MSVLFPFLPFDLAETPLSFATRCASFHMRTSMVPFLQDLRIKPDKMIGCDDDAVAQLAAVAGVDAAALLHNSARRMARRRFNLRGHVLSSEFFSTPDTVFCPACLREDDEGAAVVASVRRGRLEWTLRPVTTCPRHGLVLLRRKPQKWDDKYHELGSRVPERGDALDQLIDEAEQRAPSPFQGYVLGRLDGAEGAAWLDSQPLEQAVRATEMLGMLTAFGASKQRSHMTPQEWEAAGRVGFEITSSGESAIRDALSDVQKEFRRTGGTKGGRGNVFGPFYKWMASNKNRKDVGDIKRIMREHIFETMEIASGEIVLGEKLSERRLHSVESLAAESNLDPRTIRSVLAASGLVPVEEKVSGIHVFDAETGRKVAASVQRKTHVISLGQVLGCTRPQADQLLDEQLILQISDGAGAAMGRTRKAVDNREITKFLSALYADARPVDSAPAGMVPISKAAEKAKCPSFEIVHLILGGFLENIVRLKEIHGYAAILVDPDEVRTQIAAVMQGLSASAAFGQLKIPTSTGWELVFRNDELRLEAQIIEGKKGQHRIYRFAEDAIARFMAEFTTPARIANRQDLQIGIVINKLKRSRVRPVLAQRHVGVDFFREAEIPKFEAA